MSDRWVARLQGGMPGSRDFYTPPRLRRAVDTARRAYRAGRSLGTYFRDRTREAGIQGAARNMDERDRAHPARSPSVRGRGRAIMKAGALSNSSSVYKKVSYKNKKRKSKRKSSTFSNRQRKSVKRIARNADRMLLHCKQSNIMHQVGNSVNAVGWTELILDGNTEFKARTKYQVVEKLIATGLDAVATKDMDVTGPRPTKQYTFKDQHRFHFKNNTNSGCELIFYIVKCTQATSGTPLDEMENLRTVAYSSTDPLTMATDFNQYWTVPGLGNPKRKWIIHKKVKVVLNGGEETRLNFDFPTFRYSPAVADELGTGYQKGQFALVSRCMGKPTHDVTLFGALGMSNSLVDGIESRKEFTYAKDISVVRQQVELGNSGFALAAPVCANPEQVGVGPFDAA